jgi:NitT/TauT family transport system permease protein
MTTTANALPRTTTPPTRPRPALRKARRILVAIGWWVASIGLFAGLWELAYAVGWADPLLLPPPHIFLGDFAHQAAFFDNSTIGEAQSAPAAAVAKTVLATLMRVLAGLALGFVASLATGILITRFVLFRRLLSPTLTLLAPISTVAWLPIAIFLFGIGNSPAIFMVFIGVYFVMTLATVTEIESVTPTYLDVARTLGATRRQILFQVTLPAVLPGLLHTLRMNLFAAWMVVLIAEAAGVGSGLGQVVMLARNTFNPSLVFFTMAIIGISGYVLDVLFRQMQRRLLWWHTTRTGESA